MYVIAASNNERALHATSDVRGRRTMFMGVVPERPRGMICGHFKFVLLCLIRSHVDQDIIAFDWCGTGRVGICLWFHMQAMRVKVRGVPSVMAVHVVRARWFWR